jgi:hypothetical protein
MTSWLGRLLDWIAGWLEWLVGDEEDDGSGQE